MKHGCGKCGKDAVIVEQDVFYSCADCWIKTNKKVKRYEQNSVHRKSLR